MRTDAPLAGYPALTVASARLVRVTQPGWLNKLYYGDNLDVLKEHVPTESVDLVYLDPPYRLSLADKTLQALITQNCLAEDRIIIMGLLQAISKEGSMLRCGKSMEQKDESNRNGIDKSVRKVCQRTLARFLEELLR